MYHNNEMMDLGNYLQFYMDRERLDKYLANPRQYNKMAHNKTTLLDRRQPALLE